MGVCCIVFDIDGMLFEFGMNFLNIEKNKILRYFFQYFMFSKHFMLFPTLKKHIWCKKINFGWGGGGCGIFLEKQFFLISRFILFSTFKNIEKCPFTYWLNGRWFLQIVERDSWNLYPLYPLLYLKRGGGGLLVKWEVVSPNSRYRAFYHEIGNIEKCPFTYWLNGGGGFSKP